MTHEPSLPRDSTPLATRGVSVDRCLAGLHAAAWIVAIGCRVALVFHPGSHRDPIMRLLLAAAPLFAAIVAGTGIALMARARPREESILLACSTVLSVVLFFFLSAAV